MASAKDKLAAVSTVEATEPKDLSYNVDLSMWTYGFKGQDIYTFDFSKQCTDLRVDLNTTQASTVEVDLEDDDFKLLDDPLFANWAFNIENVSLDTAKKFKPTRLTNSTSTAYLGDSADLEWVLGQRPIDFDIDSRIAFRLCGIHAQQTTVTLTFEDRVASFLRDQKGHKSWDRNQHTRAEFVAMLCREAGVEYWIPEMAVGQPVAKSTTTSSTTSDPVNPNGKGLAKTAHLTVQGLPITQTQINVANILLGECHKLNAPLVCWQAILYAGFGETVLGALTSTYSNNGSGAIGVLQGTDPHWDANPHDTAGQADCFLKGGFGFNSAISLAKSGISDMAEIAVKSEVPSIWPANAYAAESGWNDQNVRNEIDKIIAAYGGPTAKGSGTLTTTGSYAFTRGANEDSWDCIQRLASEVAWYAFVRQNRLWFVSGNYIFAQDVEMSIERGQAGVDYIDVDLDMGARDQIAELTVTGRTGLWTALPGTVVEVLKRGPATGKWFVASATSHPLDVSQGASITLQKPVPKRAEPAANTTSSPNSVKGGVTGGSGPKTALAAYNAAQQLSDKQLTYTQGVRTLLPLARVPQGVAMYDCSASVSEVLLLAGFPLPGGATFGSWAPVSGAFVAGAATLQAGQGQQMTIWANAGHVFIEFHIPGKPAMQGNTSPGPGFRFFAWGQNGEADANGGTFLPVHYPGT